MRESGTRKCARHAEATKSNKRVAKENAAGYIVNMITNLSKYVTHISNRQYRHMQAAESRKNDDSSFLLPDLNIPLDNNPMEPANI